jgi:hypothetical protein
MTTEIRPNGQVGRVAEIADLAKLAYPQEGRNFEGDQRGL